MRAIVINPTWLYVGVEYPLTIWLACRAGADIPTRIALYFHVLVLVFFWRPNGDQWKNVALRERQET